MQINQPARACQWRIREAGLLDCINWAIVSGDLPLEGGRRWNLKRAETDAEKKIDPKFVLVEEAGISIQPVRCLIELGIRAGCIEDRGNQNARYELVSN